MYYHRVAFQQPIGKEVSSHDTPGAMPEEQDGVTTLSSLYWGGAREARVFLNIPVESIYLYNRIFKMLRGTNGQLSCSISTSVRFSENLEILNSAWSNVFTKANVFIH
jgi:hypothetical protein